MVLAMRGAFATAHRIVHSNEIKTKRHLSAGLLQVSNQISSVLLLLQTLLKEKKKTNLEPIQQSEQNIVSPWRKTYSESHLGTRNVPKTIHEYQHTKGCYSTLMQAGLTSWGSRGTRRGSPQSRWRPCSCWPQCKSNQRPDQTGVRRHRAS